MKLLLLMGLLTLSINCLAQGYGVSFGGATSKTFMFDIFFKQSVSRYHIGLSFQRNGQKGPAKTERLSNYGTTSNGSGKYFLLFDLKYSRIIKEKYSAWGEVSLGSNKLYTNYLDKRFSAGGYHLVGNSKPVAGVGVGAGYLFKHGFEGQLGFNTIRGVNAMLVLSF